MLTQAMLAVERMLRGSPSPDAAVDQVLVLEYRLPLGCCVHMTPAFEAMKRSQPELRVIVATRAIGAEVLRHSPFVDHLMATPDPLTDLPAAVSQLRGELRRRGLRPDCVLTGASDMRTRIALLGAVASNGWRGGFTLKPWLYPRALVYDPAVSLIANNRRVAKLIGCEAEVTRPRVFFSEQDVRVAKALVREANPDGRPLVTLVTQTSGGQRTGWQIERWAEAIRAVAARGLAVAYAGTASEATSIAAISQAAAVGGTSLAGRTTVSQLAAVLAMSDAVVSVDTGTMHVARAAGVPMVVLGPSWQKPLEWMPLGVENVRILRGADREQVPVDYRLDEVEAAAVIAALDELLRLYPPDEASRAARIADSLSAVDHLAASAG